MDVSMEQEREREKRKKKEISTHNIAVHRLKEEEEWREE